MGFGKGLLIFLSAVIFFGALFASNLFLTLHWSLNYDNVEASAQNLTDSFLTELGYKGTLFQEYEDKKFSCYGEQEINVSLGDEEFSIPCSVIENGGKDVIEYAVSAMTYKLYYQEYDCDFLDCIKNQNQPLVLFSDKARIYWGEQFRLAMIIALVAFVVLFFVVSKKGTAFLSGGALIIVAALPFKDVTKLLDLLPEFLPFDIVPVFFSSSYGVYVMMLVAGVVFLAIGFVINFYKYGVKMKNFFGRKKSKKINVEEKN